MKKMLIAAVPCTVLALSLFGCAQHSTAATVASPQPPAATAPASGETNTFGESREAAAGSAAAARDASINADSQPSTSK